MPAVQIPCPTCGCKRTYVVLTNQDKEGRIVRRRHCRVCGDRWYTLQQPEAEISQYDLVWPRKKPTLRV